MVTVDYKVVDAVLKKRNRESKYKKLLEEIPFSSVSSDGKVKGKALEFKKMSAVLSCRMQAVKMGVNIKYCMSDTGTYLVFKIKAEEKKK